MCLCIIKKSCKKTAGASGDLIGNKIAGISSNIYSKSKNVDKESKKTWGSIWRSSKILISQKNCQHLTDNLKLL